MPPQPEDELPAGSASVAAAEAAEEAVGGGRRQTAVADAMEPNAKMNKETKRKNEFENLPREGERMGGGKAYTRKLGGKRNKKAGRKKLKRTRICFSNMKDSKEI